MVVALIGLLDLLYDVFHSDRFWKSDIEEGSPDTVQRSGDDDATTSDERSG